MSSSRPKNAEASTQEDNAAAALLEAIISTIGPRVIEAVGTRPVIIDRSHNCNGNCYHQPEQTRTEHRALALTKRVGPSRTDGADNNAGTYEGVDLFLDREGLFELRYEGHWSRWQGAWSEWTATVRRYSTPLEAITDGWGQVEDYIARIEASLREYAEGHASTRATEALARADRLAAVAKLLTR